MVAAGGASYAEVDSAGEEGFLHAKDFGDFEGAVVRQHNAAAAHADGVGLGGDLADEDFGAGAGEVGDIVVFGDPKAAVAEPLGGAGEGDGFAEGVAG